MKAFYERLWFSLNYRYCMSSAYLASQQENAVAAADFLTRASGWQKDYLMIGRKLV